MGTRRASGEAVISMTKTQNLGSTVRHGSRTERATTLDWNARCARISRWRSVRLSALPCFRVFWQSGAVLGSDRSDEGAVVRKRDPGVMHPHEFSPEPANLDRLSSLRAMILSTTLFRVTQSNLPIFSPELCHSLAPPLSTSQEPHLVY